MSGKKSIESLTKFLSNMINKEGRFDTCLNKVEILNGGNGEITAKLKVDREHTNAMNYLHGGMTATLVDSLSSFGLLTHPKVENSGVSVNLSISYLAAVPLGEEILIVSKSDKVGKKLAFLSIEISKVTTGELVAKASHTKYLLPTPTSIKDTKKDAK